ncbi:aldo/keto reductase [Ascidiimonas sp. W6]|uniref:aldo/keto reductase n=1 Tax=Ascidiimonas meishanensis TaxID=3128903 RepID=UPI0030EBF910
MSYSKIIAGTMTWGLWGRKLDQTGMQHLMHHCLENNITTFDHADIYGGYTTEAEFGIAFAESGIRREDIQLISKCGIQLICENHPDNMVKHYNYDASYIVWSAEQSLKNLQTDYLDLLLLHRPSALMQPVEVAKAFEQLKSQGKVKAFGVSNFTPSQAELIASAAEVTVNQIEFSLTQHEAMHNGSLDQMLLKNITPMAWSPLGSVFREQNEQTKRVQQQLFDLIAKYNATADQLLLAWILKHPAGIHPVIGTTSPQRITNSVKAMDIELELQDWFLMLTTSTGHEVP